MDTGYNEPRDPEEKPTAENRIGDDIGTGTITLTIQAANPAQTYVIGALFNVSSSPLLKQITIKKGTQDFFKADTAEFQGHLRQLPGATGVDVTYTITLEHFLAGDPNAHPMDLKVINTNQPLLTVREYEPPGGNHPKETIDIILINFADITDFDPFKIF